MRLRIEYLFTALGGRRGAQTESSKEKLLQLPPGWAEHGRSSCQQTAVLPWSLRSTHTDFHVLQRKRFIPTVLCRGAGSVIPQNQYKQVKLPKVQEPRQHGKDTPNSPAWPRPPPLRPPPWQRRLHAAPTGQASRWHLHNQYTARSRRAPDRYHQGSVAKQLHSPSGAGGWELQTLGKTSGSLPHTHRL